MQRAFRWAARTPRKLSVQDRTKGNFECVFLKIMFCSERSISTYPAHKYISYIGKREYCRKSRTRLKTEVE